MAFTLPPWSQVDIDPFLRVPEKLRMNTRASKIAKSTYSLNSAIMTTVMSII